MKDPIKITIGLVSVKELDPIQAWCNEFIGSEGRDWDWRDEHLVITGGDYKYNTIFYFANPKKATLFTLRWS